MAGIRKYGDIEKVEVFLGEEAQVLNNHFSKNGKYAVSEFSDEEKEALSTELESLKKAEK